MSLILKSSLGVVVFLLTCSLSVHSQNNELNGWGSIGASFKFSKRFSSSLSHNVRYKNNISTLDERFNELGVKYKLFKGFKIGSKIRFISENDDQGKIQGKENHFRYQLSLNYKHKIARRTELSYRLQYQNKNELRIEDTHKEVVRFQLGVNYNIKPIKLTIKAENEVFYKVPTEINRYRFNLKFAKNLSKRNILEGFYRYQTSVAQVDSTIKNIIGLSFTHKFDLTNKKKE